MNRLYLQRLSAIAALAFVCLFGSAISLRAQSATGQITGTVKDSSGAIVPQARVTIRSQLTGLTRDTAVNESGNYTFALLPVGTYSVSAEADGFRIAKQSDIQLNVDQVERIDLELSVGATSETVNVEANAVAIDTETSAIGQVVSQKQVNDLPLNGRNFLSLLFLGAGAVQTSGEQSSFRKGVGDAISINGSRPTSNNYLLDGTANVDTTDNTPAVVLSVDAIQEFKEQTTTYSAEYGFSANQINLLSKSGTNDLHGTVFWFLRNSDLDARSFFEAGISPLKQNQFGFVAGGPVYLPKLYNGRNKTFWLINYEGGRTRQSSQFFANVPTASQLSGNIATNIVDPLTGTQFPGNAVPQSRYSKLAQVAIANGFFPAPNLNASQGNFRGNVATPLNTNQETYRMDQMLGRYGQIFARGTLTYLNDTTQGGITTQGNEYFGQQSTNWQVSHSIAFGGKIVNQFRIGFIEATANQFGTAAPESAVTAMGLTGVFQNIPDIQRTWPSLSLNTFSTAGGAINAYTASNQPMLDTSDSLTWVRGSHTLTMGANYRRWKLNRDLADNFLGNFTYQGYFSGNSVADFLLGYYSNAAVFQPAGFSVAGKVGNPRQFNFQYFAPYFQDDWKVNSRLTLNLGLRWDYRAAAYETNNRYGWLDVTNPLGGVCIADQKLIGEGVAPAGNGFYRYCGRRNPADGSKTPFAPRFGFAYRPFHGDKTVVRGGYGIFFDSAEGREIDGSSDIYPYVSRGSYSQTLGQTAALQTTDQLFPNFGTPGPVTPAANSFIAVIVSEHPKNPYVQQWSFSVQHQLTPNTTLEVNYIGNKGTNLLERRNINQAYAPTDPANPTPVLSRRPYSQFGVYIDSDWSGLSSYNSGNIKLEHRTGSFLLTAVYTWAKSIDTKSAAAGIGNAATGWQGFLDNHSTKLDRGLSDFDVDHRMVTSFVYNLPFGKGHKYLSNVNRAADAFVGGWQANGIYTLQAGFPYPVFALDAGGLLDSFSNRANLVGNPYSGFHQSLSEWFNTAAFAQPAAGVYGTSGRNILRAPGLDNFDLSAFKNFTLLESLHLQFRVESFNTLNHAQFGVPSNNISSRQYGQITGTSQPGRINQMGLKIIF